MLRLQKTTKKFCQIKKNDYLCTRKQGNIVGALDEWLSQRSAKPSTAVRIRQAPQSRSGISNQEFHFSFLSTPRIHWSLYSEKTLTPLSTKIREKLPLFEKKCVNLQHYLEKSNYFHKQ